ncbi:MAG: hypothetical protein ACK521_02575 [bacterium]
MLDNAGHMLRKVMRQMYKEPETAFAVFNFTGESTITIDDILRQTTVV